MRPESILRIAIVSLFILLPGCLLAEPSKAQTTIIRHPVGRNDQDRRYEYMKRLLQLILEKTRPTHGSYQLTPATPMTQDRMIQQLESGRLDVAQFPIRADLNQRFLPVEIPIRKGMLGWRLLLIRKQDQERFAQVRSIEDLKRFTAGFGSQWGDLGILEANVGQVITHVHYEQLFAMLMAGRFDYLHRGLHEPWLEVKDRKETFPDLHVEQTLVLHYPIANYLYVGKHDPKLAKRLTQGFRQTIADRSFDRFFNDEYGETIRRANIENRHLIAFDNPFLPPDTPLEIKPYWLDFGRLPAAGHE